jgi:hypothetical protein
MNKKIFGVIAASITALGSAIIAVPAQAVEQTVNVSVNVEPFIYLRTFQDVKLKVNQGDLGGKSGDFNSTLMTDGSTLIDRTKPDFGTVTPVPTKDILTGPIGSDAFAKITVGEPIGDSQKKPNNKTPFVGGVKLNISFQDDIGTAATPVAGDYTGGQIKVDASQL